VARRLRATLGELRSVVELHAEEEEDILFPRLERALDAGAMHELGLSMMALYHAKIEAGYAREGARSPHAPQRSTRS
jgi:iron-sulfur cluster repair protein YtfE (RIC family)